MDMQRFYIVIGLVAFLALLAGIGCSHKGAGRMAALDIWRAVEKEDLKAIASYVQAGGDLEVGATALGKTPLLHALKLKKKDSYSQLLSLGANPNTECRDGVIVVHYAALEEDPFWLGEALKSGGDANLMNNAKEISKGTPLYFAIGEKTGIQNVELLCEHGADVNAPCDYLERTPLAIASGEARFDIVHYLLEQDADPADPGPGHESNSFMGLISQQTPRLYHNPEERKWCQAVWEWLAARGMDPANAKWDGSRWTWN